MRGWPEHRWASRPTISVGGSASYRQRHKSETGTCCYSFEAVCRNSPAEGFGVCDIPSLPVEMGSEVEGSWPFLATSNTSGVLSAGSFPTKTYADAAATHTCHLHQFHPRHNHICFVPPNPCDRSGNESRNTLMGPGLVDCDFSVVNNIPFKAISENFNAQFRTEFFNILNRPNFQSPNDNRTIMDQSGNLIPFAGAITPTNTTSRQLQFALKLSW